MDNEVFIEEAGVNTETPVSTPATTSAKKKRHIDIPGLIFKLIFIIGFLVFMYPTVSDAYNKMRDARLVDRYAKKVSNMSHSEKQNAIYDAVAYNESLVNKHRNVVSEAQYETDDEVYESLISLDSRGLMGYIDIPRIAVSLPIYHYSTDSVLEKGVGHIHGSSLPIGGDGTHAVLIAHRGLPSSKLFSDLPEMKVGDMFYIHVFDEVLAYKVYSVDTVLPDEVENLVIEDGNDLVTLVTCTPYGVNTHRLLVKGKRVPYKGETTTAKVTNVIKHTVDPKTWAAIGVAIFMLILFFIKRKERKNKKRKVAQDTKADEIEQLIHDISLDDVSPQSDETHTSDDVF